MKKLLLSILLGAACMGMVNANDIIAAQPKYLAQTDPVCKPAIEYMRTNHQKVMAAINANKPTQVGKLVIAGHKYMESFIAENPQCKPIKLILPTIAEPTEDSDQ